MMDKGVLSEVVCEVLKQNGNGVKTKTWIRLFFEIIVAAVVVTVIFVSAWSGISSNCENIDKEINRSIKVDDAQAKQMQEFELNVERIKINQNTLMREQQVVKEDVKELLRRSE